MQFYTCMFEATYSLHWKGFGYFQLFVNNIKFKLDFMDMQLVLCEASLELIDIAVYVHGNGLIWQQVAHT